MHKTTIDSIGSSVTRRNLAFLVFCILFVSINMRGPITGLSPLLELMRQDFTVSNTMAGFLTTIPLLAFALLSPFVAKLAGSYGMEKIIFFAMVILVAGGWMRPFGGISLLITGTFLTGLAIAVLNVILPGLIKREFPLRIGIMTSVYSICTNVFAAIASALSLPLAVNLGLGWQGSLLTWTVLAMASLLCWIPQLRHNKVAKLAARSHTSGHSVWRSPIAWKITFFMGLQSMIYYVSIAWLPDILQEQGMSRVQSGYMLSLMQFSMLPFNFIIPILAARLKTQRVLVFGTVVLYLIALFGIMMGSGHMGWIAFCLILLGIAGAAAFSLSMMFFNLRTRTPEQATEVSGMAQSVGYLLAACGPTLFGILHDATGTWTIPLTLLVAAAASLLYTGFGAGSRGYIYPEPTNDQNIRTID
ncbi:CynX/NimT family MFS transporter [Paenibacillus bovis]|uniref:Transporter n=1 Tax=Paenibacillus bovis TaxID=1616788 RepID=A0A172ZCX0_9BACL|nr:MFS transporter [Paenibacillus bovis]ANF95353.1 transporter [Paenibacillus bovis]